MRRNNSLYKKHFNCCTLFWQPSKLNSAGILLFEDAVLSIDNMNNQQHVKIKDINLHSKYPLTDVR